MNDNNLIPFNQMSEQRHKELSRLGGLKSAEVRKQRAKIKKSARYISRLVNETIQCTQQEYEDFQKWRKRKKYRTVPEKEYNDFKKWREGINIDK